jgi:hypothetical protein
MRLNMKIFLAITILLTSLTAHARDDDDYQNTGYCAALLSLTNEKDYAKTLVTVNNNPDLVEKSYKRYISEYKRIKKISDKSQMEENLTMIVSRGIDACTFIDEQERIDYNLIDLLAQSNHK